jgi:hypothetical protein
VHHLERVVGPARGPSQRTSHRERDRLGGEPDHVGRSDGVGHHRGERRQIGVVREAGEGRIDPRQRVVGLEEEVAADPDGVHDAALDLHLGGNELAAGHLVLTSHESPHHVPR